MATKHDKPQSSQQDDERSPSNIQPSIKSNLQPVVESKLPVAKLKKKETDKMPDEVQAKMETGFGQDFSGVRIHKDSGKAEKLDATAYTKGNDIYFAPGAFQPRTKEGQALIAHELTHVVQQRQGKAGNADVHGKDLVNSDPALEKEADDAGKKVSEGERVEVNGSGSGVQRKEKGEPDYAGIAKRIYDSLSVTFIFIPYTLEEEVISELSKLDNNITYINKLKSVYQVTYGSDLEADLRADFSGEELKTVLSLIAGNVSEENVSKKTAKDTDGKRPESTSDIVISTSVGNKIEGSKKKFNQPADVRKIQNQLFSLGYLSKPDYDKEKAVVDTDKEILTTSLVKTIDAIRAFQKSVLNRSTPDGVISPSGTDIQYLNTATKLPQESDFKEISNNRKDFTLVEKSGKELFKSGLVGAVGDTDDGNYVNDIKMVQKRLIELGFLSTASITPIYKKGDATKVIDPKDSIDAILNFYQDYKDIKTKVKKIHIPETITAIKKFQKSSKYNISYWQPKINKPKGTIGVIGIDDTSFFILKEATKFSLTYGSNKVANFSNFQMSGYTASYEGIAYTGTKNPGNLIDEYYKEYNLTEKQRDGLKEASSHEANLEGLNTYDQAIISYGMIQFAGGPVGNFSRILARFKEKSPQDFNNLFRRYGIDVEYNYSTKADGTRVIGDKAFITVIDVDKKRLLRGIEAERYLRANPKLLGTLLKASDNKNMQVSQLEFSIDEYVTKAMQIRLNSKINVVHLLADDKISVSKTYVGAGRDKYITENKAEFLNLKKEARIKEYSIDLTNTKISEIMSSEKGIATLISLYINNPASTISYCRRAVIAVIEEENLDTKEKILKISDEKILNWIIKEGNRVNADNVKTNNTPFPARVSKIVKSTESDYDK